jgi:alanine racemase
MEGERAYVKIDLDAIGHNVDLVRRKVGSDVKILGVIKANAYGHGAPEVASYLASRVDYFAVATVEEALQLRACGINQPILILADVPETRLAELIRNRITITVSTRRNAETLSKAASALNMNAILHIALDTGMTRIGFRYDDIQEILRIKDLPNLTIEGIFTHYSCADMADKAYSKKQLERFGTAIYALEQQGLRIPVKHISNSAGIIEFDANHLNMVRAGILIYGLYPSDEVNPDFGLKPAMSFYARVNHVKTVEAGHGVSYGATYVTKAPTVIATLSVGYADGYPRALSGKGRVLIHGQYAPILGRVCMDQMMVDVTHIPDVVTGDFATLVGTDGNNTLSVEELADNAASFNYEFVCGIGMRVPRIYWKDGKEYKRVCCIEPV